MSYLSEIERSAKVLPNCRTPRYGVSCSEMKWSVCDIATLFEEIDVDPCLHTSPPAFFVSSSPMKGWRNRISDFRC